MSALDSQQGCQNRQRAMVGTFDWLPLSRSKDQRAAPQQLKNRCQGSVDHLNVRAEDKPIDLRSPIAFSTTARPLFKTISGGRLGSQASAPQTSTRGAITQ